MAKVNNVGETQEDTARPQSMQPKKKNNPTPSLQLSLQSLLQNTVSVAMSAGR